MTHLKHVLYPRSRMRLNNTLDPDQWFDLCIQSVAHQLKFSVRRNKANGSIILKATQSHTLVELHILHLDCFASCRSSGRLEHDFVIQPQA